MKRILPDNCLDKTSKFIILIIVIGETKFLRQILIFINNKIEIYVYFLSHFHSLYQNLVLIAFYSFITNEQKLKFEA
jgi:hypothetical protein